MKQHYRYRSITPRLLEALSEAPVVLLQGTRQCGKSTLVQSIIEDRGGRYVSLDDDDARLFATTDPQGFVDALPFNSAIDEIQRAPNLLLAIKRSVDKQRVPGRFLLTDRKSVL